jgi:hypothetical protein
VSDDGQPAHLVDLADGAGELKRLVEADFLDRSDQLVRSLDRSFHCPPYGVVFGLFRSSVIGSRAAQVNAGFDEQRVRRPSPSAFGPDADGECAQEWPPD